MLSAFKGRLGTRKDLRRIFRGEETYTQRKTNAHFSFSLSLISIYTMYNNSNDPVNTIQARANVNCIHADALRQSRRARTLAPLFSTRSSPRWPASPVDRLLCTPIAPAMIFPARSVSNSFALYLVRTRWLRAVEVLKTRAFIISLDRYPLRCLLLIGAHYVARAHM